MSHYTMYYNTKQTMYRDLAIRWKRWADRTPLSEQEIRGLKMFFRSIARRFGLITEFREIGVI